MQASAYFGVAVLCQQIVTVRCLPDTQTCELKCKPSSCFVVFFIFGFQFTEKLQESSRWFSGFMRGIRACGRLLLLPEYLMKTYS